MPVRRGRMEGDNFVRMVRNDTCRNVRDLARYGRQDQQLLTKGVLKLVCAELGVPLRTINMLYNFLSLLPAVHSRQIRRRRRVWRRQIDQRRRLLSFHRVCVV